MASNSLKLIFLCVLVCFFNFTTNKAQNSDAFYLGQRCGENRTTANSTYQTNLRSLLSTLSSYAAANKLFYNDTVVGSNSSDDTVYGLFMCRGDVPSQLCSKCVVNATYTLSSDPRCFLFKEGVIWYDECMVRYSNVFFFSTVDSTSHGFYMYNLANISSNSTSFMSLVSNTMNQAADEAASSINRYSTKQATLSSIQTIYCLAQCTQDLSPQNCTTCLSQAIGVLPWCCVGKQGGRVLYPSCNIRYELFPFFRNVTEEARPQGLVPETKYPYIDSEYSEDPGYIFHNCSSIASNSAFQSDLNTLLSYLSSNATSGNEFYTEQEGTANGLYSCRVDIPPPLCGKCVQNAIQRIASGCRLPSTEAVIWYNHCWLRYSNRNFLSSMETSPRFRELNITNANPVQSSVAFQLSTKLAEIATKTGNSHSRYRTESLRLNGNQTLYILAQCTSDLSTNSCIGCLNDVIGIAIPWSSLGSVGGRVLYPSCILRFEFFKFYDLNRTTSPPPPPGHAYGWKTYCCEETIEKF